MRDAPAFQEYAASMLANSRYRLMSLAERGLLDTLRRECWVNIGVPAKPATLAKMLGFEAAEIDAALPVVMPFFSITQDGLIVCPELDELRATYAERRERQAAGGKRSAEKRKGEAAGVLQGTSKHLAGSSQVRRQDKTKPDQSKAVAIEGGTPCKAYKEWMRGDTDPDAYRQASDGD
jgi:uncharacterized protein YdaU (DUF1376 family)